jgi:hypothetical protein
MRSRTSCPVSHPYRVCRTDQVRAAAPHYRRIGRVLPGVVVALGALARTLQALWPKARILVVLLPSVCLCHLSIHGASAVSYWRMTSNNSFNRTRFAGRLNSGARQQRNAHGSL